MRKYLPVMMSIALAAPIFACGNQEEGNEENQKQNQNTDNTDRPNSNTDKEVVSNSKIAKINQGLITKDSEVEIEAVVTAVEEYSKYDDTTGKYVASGLSGFFVSDIIDTAAPYTGIFAKYPQQGELGSIAIGDVVTVKGTVAEYYGAKQISIASVSKTGTHSIPAPAVITDLSAISTKFTYSDADGFYSVGTSGKDAAKYVGVLVKIQNVESTIEKVATLNTNGKNCKDPDTRPLTDTGCTANSGFEVNDSLVVGNENMYYVPNTLRTVGTKFTSITGIMDYNYNAYVLLPRIADDVVAQGSGSNTGDDEGDSSSDRTYEEASIADIQAGSIADDTYVSVNGTIISHTSAPYDNSKSFYIADNNGNAILIYSASYAEDATFDRGTKVTVTGSVSTYNDQVEVKGAGKPAMTVVTTGDEPDAKTITLPVDISSRGKLAKIENLTVKEAADGYCSGGTATNYCTATLEDASGNTVKVKYLKIGKQDTYYSTLKTLIGDNFSENGKEFASVTGILDVSYGEIVLYPRSQDDILAK